MPLRPKESALNLNSLPKTKKSNSLSSPLWLAVWILILAMPMQGLAATKNSGKLNFSNLQQFWLSPFTRQSLASGGLHISKQPTERKGWIQFTGKAPGVLASVPLPIKPGSYYRLSFQLRRESFINSHYLSLNLFGKEFWLDSHCVAGGWQDFSVEAKAPASGKGRATFRNDVDSRFALRHLKLQLVTAKTRPTPATTSGAKHPFPLGAYQGGKPDFKNMAACGLNTVVIGSSPLRVAQLLKEAHHNGLKVILSLPVEPKRISALAKPIASLPASLRPLYFYLVDEPEIRSFPLVRLIKARKELQRLLPWARTATAIVRPGKVAFYAPAYDAVFMDQYPIPSQPLNWLADSVAQARKLVRPNGQVWAVVQAFGGGKFTAMGWPRPPRPEEINALTASALTAGAQGLLFYNWHQLTSHKDLRNEVCGIAHRLKSLQSWLPLKSGLPAGMSINFLGRAQRDPGGGPAVRTGWSLNQRGLLLMAVNVLPHEVRLAVKASGYQAKKLFGGRSGLIAAGELRHTMEPLGVRVWLLNKETGRNE